MNRQHFETLPGSLKITSYQAGNLLQGRAVYCRFLRQWIQLDPSESNEDYWPLKYFPQDQFNLKEALLQLPLDGYCSDFSLSLVGYSLEGGSLRKVPFRDGRSYFLSASPALNTILIYDGDGRPVSLPEIMETVPFPRPFRFTAGVKAADAGPRPGCLLKGEGITATS